MDCIALFYFIPQLIDGELVQFCCPTGIAHVVECTYFRFVPRQDTCLEYGACNGAPDCPYQCKRGSQIISIFLSLSDDISHDLVCVSTMFSGNRITLVDVTNNNTIAEYRILLR